MWQAHARCLMTQTTRQLEETLLCKQYSQMHQWQRPQCTTQEDFGRTRHSAKVYNACLTSEEESHLLLSIASWVGNFLFDTDHSSLQLYMTVYTADHQACQYSDWMSTVNCYSHSRLVSRFKCGCHGLQSRLLWQRSCTLKQGRHGLSCVHVGSIEGGNHFLSDCPAYSHICQQYSHLFHQASSSIAAFLVTDLRNDLHAALLGCNLNKVFSKIRNQTGDMLLLCVVPFFYIFGVHLHLCAGQPWLL